MTEFLEDDNPENIKPPVVTKFFYDAANLVVVSIDSGRLPEELANTTPRSYGIVAQPKDTDKQGVLYYLNFWRGVGDSITGHCRTELSVVQLSEDDRRVALTVQASGEFKAMSLFRGNDGLLKSRPRTLSPDQTADFLSSFYEADGSFNLEVATSIPPEIKEYMYNAWRTVIKIKNMNAPDDEIWQATISNRLGAFFKNVFLKPPDESIIPVPNENVPPRYDNDDLLRLQIESFTDTKSLIGAVANAFLDFKMNSQNDTLNDEGSIDLDTSREEIYIKAGNKYWKLSANINHKGDVRCDLEEVPVGNEDSFITYNIDSQSGRLWRAEIYPDNSDSELMLFKQAMAIATELEFIAKPYIDSATPAYKINSEVTPVGGHELLDVLARNCKYKQNVYRTPCHCSIKH